MKRDRIKLRVEQKRARFQSPTDDVLLLPEELTDKCFEKKLVESRLSVLRNYLKKFSFRLIGKRKEVVKVN